MGETKTVPSSTALISKCASAAFSVSVRRRFSSCLDARNFLCESPLILNLLHGGVGKFVFAGFTAAAELLPDGGHGKTNGNDGRKLVDAFVSG